MRRNTVRWGFGIAVVVSMSGCASLLGDFTTNGESSGDDGGPKTDGAPSTTDGQVNGDDGGPTPDAGNDGTSPQDAPADAVDANDAPAPAPLSCVEQLSGGRTRLGSIAKPQSNDGSRVQLFNTSLGNQTRYRAFVPENSSSGPEVFHLYSFSNGGGSSNANDTPIPVPSNNGSVLSVVRYPTGIAAFVFGNVLNAGATSPTLEVLKLEDSASDWASPVILGTLATTCVNRVEGELFVNNAAANDYFLEVLYQQCAPSTTNVHIAGHFQNNIDGTVFWPLPADTVENPDGGDASIPSDAGNAFDLGGLVTAGTQVFAMTNVSGNNGPVPGIGTTFYQAPTSLAGGETQRQLPLANPTDFMQGLALGTLPNAGGLGVALLEANLNSQTVTPVIYAGTVSPPKMASLVPSKDLRATTLASISDLPINNATYHWESFATPSPSDNLLAVGTIFPNSNGLNFLWWDGAGDLRAQRTNTTAFFYFDPTGAAGLSLYGGDVTFSSPPFAAIAGFELVFIQADPEASTQNDVWATQINCTPK